MMRLLPRTITAQITGLVVLSLLVAYGVTAALLYFREPAGPRPPAQGPIEVAARVAAIVQLVEADTSAAASTAILTAAQRTGMDVFHVPAAAIAELTSGDPETLRFARILTRLLGDGFTVRTYRLGLEQARTVGAIVLRDGAPNALRFRVVIQAPPSPPRRRGLPPLVLALAVIGSSVALLSVYAVRSIIAPLSAFASAAQSFGQAAPDEPLPESGPHEIVQVAHALNDMRARVYRMVDQRTRMLVALGRDLRTPLNRLRQRAEAVSDAAQRDGLLREIESIDLLLREALHYLDEEAASEAPATADLPAVLRTICAGLAEDDHAVSYSGPEALAYPCRPAALTRALTTMVENGVRHGANVAVDLQVLPDESLKIDIADDGPGVPAHLREDMFAPFFTAESAANPRPAGSGPSLAMARDIIKAHGGRVMLLDRQPQGLIMRLSLPKAGTSPLVPPGTDAG